MTFAGKIIELFLNPQIIPVCIQYDTTDVNIKLTVYGYDLFINLRCCVYPFFFAEAIASVASVDVQLCQKIYIR